MAPRRKHQPKFVWDKERSNFLLHCYEVISAKQLLKKQLQVQLRKMFRERYTECELAYSTLYTYALTVKKEKPLPDNSRVSFWNQETDEFLIECVLRAQVENRRVIDLGLMAGKIVLRYLILYRLCSTLMFFLASVWMTDGGVQARWTPPSVLPVLLVFRHALRPRLRSLV
ncbi:hypothetical protein CBL_10638 [Carabus blaptoides fortunei]